jgi:hypothetical protein
VITHPAEELYNLNSVRNIISIIEPRRMGWAEHVACVREIGNAYKVLVGNSEKERPFGEPEHG